MNSQKYFDEVAGQWEDMRQNFFPDSLRDTALTAAGTQADQVAADIGAGTGFITSALVEAGVRVIAVDQSAEMLAEMKRRFSAMESIEYRVGEAENLPLADGEADHTFANMYLHHVENPAISIKEMARILKSGGKLVITDVDEHEHQFLLQEHHDRWPGFKREEVARWFTEAGLTDVSVNGTNDNCRASSESGTDRADISIFIAIGAKA